MNRDFAEMLKALGDEGVEYLVGGLTISILSRRHLIANKRATGRPQDLADVARLEATE